MGGPHKAKNYEQSQIFINLCPLADARGSVEAHFGLTFRRTIEKIVIAQSPALPGDRAKCLES